MKFRISAIVLLITTSSLVAQNPGTDALILGRALAPITLRDPTDPFGYLAALEKMDSGATTAADAAGIRGEILARYDYEARGYKILYCGLCAGEKTGIDLIATKNGKIYIVEVKNHAQLKGIGALDPKTGQMSDPWKMNRLEKVYRLNPELRDIINGKPLIRHLVELERGKNSFQRTILRTTSSDPEAYRVTRSRIHPNAPARFTEFLRDNLSNNSAYSMRQGFALAGTAGLVTGAMDLSEWWAGRMSAHDLRDKLVAAGFASMTAPLAARSMVATANWAATSVSGLLTAEKIVDKGVVRTLLKFRPSSGAATFIAFNVGMDLAIAGLHCYDGRCPNLKELGKTIGKDVAIGAVVYLVTQAVLTIVPGGQAVLLAVAGAQIVFNVTKGILNNLNDQQTRAEEASLMLQRALYIREKIQRAGFEKKANALVGDSLTFDIQDKLIRATQVSAPSP